MAKQPHSFLNDRSPICVNFRPCKTWIRSLHLKIRAKNQNIITLFLFSFQQDCVLLFFFFFLSSLGLRRCSWAFSSCNMPASHWDGFSCCQAQALGQGSFSSCGTELSCLSTCNLSRLGIEPVFPMLADRFSTTGPPGKSLFYFVREREERYKPNRSKIHLLEYGSYE